MKGAMDTNGPGTIVGVNVSLSGTLKDQNDISVFGMVEGEVVSEKTVTIGQTAQVKGPVKGELVTIAGVVRGAISASEKLELLETGRVFGSIETKNLVIHSGGLFVGKCEMPTGEETVEEPEAVADSASEETSTEETLVPDEE
ncbi:MAG: polymer-forming cytoskeletal protein [Patescibacteria group bacterium]